MPLLVVALLSLSAQSPEERAIAYLAHEVPAWSATNKCFSCHNNGNAARALFTATRLGYAVPDKALADTTRWLAKPDSWFQNGGDQPFNDRHLATVQFTLALLDAVESGRLRDRQPLVRAVELIIPGQHQDGSWSVGSADAIGSPTTLGTVLATSELRQLLVRTDAARCAEPIRRADSWLRRQPVKTVVEAAAVLLALAKAEDDNALSQRKACLAILRKGESKSGGWGPYVNSGPEVFDTALVVLALSRQPETDENRAWLRRGRNYLLRTQQEDGSWPETTRPADEISYAERLSTCGWATRALLATR